MKAQLGHDLGQGQQAVEIGAADMHAACGEDICLPVDAAGALGRQADHGEIRGAAADIGDDGELFVVDRLLIVEGGGDGLELELDMLEPLPADRRFELALGLAIGGIVVVDKADGAAGNGALQRLAGVFFGTAAQFAHIGAEDLGEGDPAAP